MFFSHGSFRPLRLSLFANMHASGFSVYSGHQSILVPPLELESNASLWLAAVSQYKVRVTFCSYSVMEMCTKGLGSQTEALRVSSTPQVLCVVTGKATNRSIFSSLFHSFPLPNLCHSAMIIESASGQHLGVCLQIKPIVKRVQSAQ